MYAEAHMECDGRRIRLLARIEVTVVGCARRFGGDELLASGACGRKRGEILCAR